MVKLRDHYIHRVTIYHSMGGCKTAENACEEMAEVSPAFVRLIAYRLYGDKSRWGVDPRWNFRFRQKENSRLAYQTRVNYISETRPTINSDRERRREEAMRFASRRYSTVEYERSWTPQDQYHEFQRALG